MLMYIYLWESGRSVTQETSNGRGLSYIISLILARRMVSWGVVLTSLCAAVKVKYSYIVTLNGGGGGGKEDFCKSGAMMRYISFTTIG